VRRELRGAGIVHKNVDAAPFIQCRFGKLLAIFVFRHIALNDQHIAARLAHGIGGFVRFLLGLGIVDHNFRAALGQPDGHGRADSRCGACDDGHFAAELFHVPIPVPICMIAGALIGSASRQS
jgi:hypothetical protein